MKLALEHIQQSIALIERRLEIVRDAKSALQAQIDGHAAEITEKQMQLVDLRAALAVLRAQSPEVPVKQLTKTQMPRRADKP